ncbi:MAG TPA: hypothetical protein VNM45_10385 [Bacillus sp. (in: firmicutes)]|nr:hypothetical protein [Bacillus sp. (in: firmicutes)]
MVFLMLCLFTGAFFIGLIRKYIFGIKDPDIQELWQELDKEGWYQELLQNPTIKNSISYHKEHGLLSDPYYVRKIIDREEHRKGFIHYVSEKG